MKAFLVTSTTVMVLVGIIIDVFSLVLAIKRLRGEGPSGFGIVALWLYWAAIALLKVGEIVNLTQAIIYAFVATIVFFSIHIGVLWMLDIFLPRGDAKKADESKG